MMIPGYCEKCHRPRPVRVTGPLHTALLIGVCQECEDERADARRREVGRPPRRRR